MAPPKRKTGGRTTPKGSQPGEQKFANPEANTRGVHSSSRYTPPVPAEVKMPKVWVPYLMVTLLILGMILIMARNLVWQGSNLLLLAGLGSILGGLYTATKWR